MKLGRMLTVARAALCLALLGVLLLDPGQALAAGLNLSPASLDASLIGGALAFGLGGTVTLVELRQKRGKLLEEMDTITRSELTDESRARFDTLDTELRTADADIERMTRLEEAQRTRALEQAPPPPETRSDTVPAAPAGPRDLGHEVGGFIRSYAMAQLAFRSGERMVQPAEVAKGLYGERHPITLEVTRAQTLSANADGGFLVSPTYASELIRQFAPKTVVRRRARVVPGNSSYLRGKGGATVGYVGEGEQGAVTGVKFGLMDMTEKDISAILPISKKLLRNANTISTESYCRDELVRGATEFEDRKCLYGTGVGKEVKGYAYSILPSMKFDAGALTTPNNAQVRAVLRKLLKAMALANVEIDGNEPAWFMNPAIKMYLEDLYQGDVKAFPTLEGPNPTLLGYPVDTTTHITGPAGDGGEIFFGAHRFAMIGDSVAMSLSVSDQASFTDASGRQVNMWAQGLMAIKLDMSHDFALQHEEAFGMVTGVKWGQ
ncbi:capsid protein [Pseudoroseomonas deserti]|uniref:Capsid protein n=1 Tax=Teichococcus deserti TaxID=1817963 RepID=A0A1V2H2U6_9PROT|nr:phage major capsid protein [Pseudoroseomonas deserti]ONG53454.1 capsid protein [Pseudoroseomonas deserti]